MSNCRETLCHKEFVYKENKSKLVLINTDQVESIRITVDGCLYRDNRHKKCDYLHLAKNLAFLIELKGQDIETAIEQLEISMKLLSDDIKDRVKNCYIICSRVPLSSTDIQNLQKKFKKNNVQANLLVKSSPFTDKY